MNSPRPRLVTQPRKHTFHPFNMFGWCRFVVCSPSDGRISFPLFGCGGGGEEEEEEEEERRRPKPLSFFAQEGERAGRGFIASIKYRWRARRAKPRIQLVAALIPQYVNCVPRLFPNLLPTFHFKAYVLWPTRAPSLLLGLCATFVAATRCKPS